MTTRRVNIADPELEFDAEDPPGFRAGMLRPGPGFGAEGTGASLYELPPGEAVCPYHYEYAEEEWLLVLSGTPSVRTPEGTEQLAPLDLVFFPRGPDGAHHEDRSRREHVGEVEETRDDGACHETELNRDRQPRSDRIG